MAKDLRRSRLAQAGVTLMEMLVVVTLVSLLIGIAVPSFQAGLPSIRLRGASSSIAQLLSAARNQVERNQLPVVLRVVPERGRLSFQSAGPLGRRGPVAQEIEMPVDITIRGVYPSFPGRERAARDFVLFPGGSVPPLAILVANQQGAQRWVSLDPITYVPLIETAAPAIALPGSATGSSEQ